MKRPIIIIISVVVVFLLLGTIFTSMTQFGGRTSVQDPVFGYGGGGGAPDLYSAEEPAAAPA